MEFNNNKKNIVLFHIISPVFLLILLLLYSILPKSKEINYTILLLVLIDFLFNILTLFIVYNKITLNNKVVVVTRGLLTKKRITIKYKNIKEIEKTGLRKPGFKPFDAIIPLKGLFYNPKRDKLKIYKGYIDDLDFEKFEKELKKRIQYEKRRS